MRTGSGRHTYELVENWPKMPEQVKLGYTHGVITDRSDRVYIHNQSPHAVAIFEADGSFVGAWGERFAGGAHGMAYHVEGEVEYLYLTDYAQQKLVKTTLGGDVVLEIGHPPREDLYPDPARYRPTDTAVAPNGDIFITDGYGSNWIHKYTGAGEYVKSFGGPGNEPGQLACPHGVWIDTDGPEPLLVVADRANVRIQELNLDGEPVAVHADELRHPCDFQRREGDLLCPDLHGRVSIFDRDYRLICHLGDNPGVQQTPGYPNLPHDQRIPGKFISPHAAWWDSKGDLYVVEWVSDGRVSKFARV